MPVVMYPIQHSMSYKSGNLKNLDLFKVYIPLNSLSLFVFILHCIYVYALIAYFLVCYNVSFNPNKY